jgi:1,4-dihydroxy-2-naphthoate octaprenyltransferase
MCGLPLVIHGGWPILIIGLSSFIFAYLYTAGPFPLAYHGLGDLFVFIYFGLIAVMGSYYLQTGFIDKNAMWLGISIGAKNVLLLTVNNIRDYAGDKEVDKKTVIVIFGKCFGRLQALSMIILSYLGLFLLSLGLNNKLIFYIIMMGLPLSLSILNDIYNKKGEMLNKTLGKVVMLLCLEGLLLVIGVSI